MECPIPYVYQAYGKKAKARNNKYHIILDFEPIVIPERFDIDAPIIIDSNEMQVRYYDQKFWYPYSIECGLGLPNSIERRHIDMFVEIVLDKIALKHDLFKYKPMKPESGDFYYNEYAYDILMPDEFVRNLDSHGETKDCTQSWALENVKIRMNDVLFIEGYLWITLGEPIIYTQCEYQNAGKWVVNGKNTAN